MFLNTASPRRSFNIPININLQGARRRQTRELENTAAAPEQEWSRGCDSHRAQRSRTLLSVSSIGEDRAILLGFTMMAFAVLMFFVVGFTIVKPHINSDWEGRANCTLVHTQVLEEWVSCRGVSTVPCLRATVNLSGTGQGLLHYDEEAVLLTPECFYVPKCHLDAPTLASEVEEVKKSLDTYQGRTFTCLTDQSEQPKDGILDRKYSLRTVVLALLWPCLMLGGGVLLVGLVKLTQYLSHLSSEGGHNKQAKGYTLLRRSSLLPEVNQCATI
ncbi:calcium-activated potassium channel subunit beta-3 [Eucyclogobius newberryi]|uniref:calcium-activated potassium channel subunit beta-3 n=1 Tax=Eucyclogobius newberryi TaxID=166745 RepID=UPI003B5985D2